MLAVSLEKMENNSKIMVPANSRMVRKKDLVEENPKEKENERVRLHNKKMQDKDLPRFKNGGETHIETAGAVYEVGLATETPDQTDL